MGCCLEKLSEEEHVPTKKSRPVITLIPPSDDEKSDDQKETSFSSKEVKRMMALYDYSSRNAGDLSFRKLEEFDSLKGINEDWCYVTRLDTGEKGYVPRNFICFADSLQSQRWFFGTITRKDSEILLLKMTERGSFLIRESETSENSYSLSVLNVNNMNGLYVKHYRMRYNNESFYITDGVEFSKLSSLIAFYQNRANGLCCQLTEPCTFRDTPQTYSLAPHTTTIEEDDVTLQEKLSECHKYSVTHKYLWKGEFPLSVTEYKVPPLSILEELRKIHHKNVLKYFGNIPSNPLKLCWEYLDGGSLSKYLRHNSLEISTLINITTQVATGMAYLETIPFAHRYLRARYISVGEGPTFKVAEYGLSASPKGIDPDAHIWLSLESIKKDEFNIKTDVWSYGVLVAEIFNKGENPFPDKDLSINEFLEKVYSGSHIPQPRDCPHSLYELMTQCWDANPDFRPTFEYIQIFMESFFLRKDINGSNSEMTSPLLSGQHGISDIPASDGTSST